MPILLEGAVRFPTSYEPWYVYKATLVGTPTAFEYLDVIVPDAAGLFDRLETDDADLTTGYAFALEKFVTGMTEVQVAVPGSAVPFIVDSTVRPTSLVKFNFAVGVQTAVIANAADLAAGRALGRARNHHEDHETLRLAIADDIMVILTGCV